MHADAAKVKLARMALELAEKLSHANQPIVLMGIAPGGTTLAEALKPLLAQHLANSIQTVQVKLNKKHPVDIEVDAPIDLTDKHLVLVDDVANSGKTLLYALKPTLAFQPASITTMVLVERMHRTFPVQPDVVGMSVSTTPQQHIVVESNGQEVLGVYVQ